MQGRVLSTMPEEIEGKLYLTTAEAAEYLGVSQGWFTRTVVSKYKLQGYKRGVGREIYYEKIDLEPILSLRPVEVGGEGED